MSSENSSGSITVLNENGVHARPASYLTKLANSYKSKITLKYNNHIADARSVISILGLGLKAGDQLEIVAVGEDSAGAVKGFKEAFEEYLGEEHSNNYIPNTNKANQTNSQTSIKQETITSVSMLKSSDVLHVDKRFVAKGVVASPGFAIGQSYYFSKDSNFKIVEKITDYQQEYDELINAIDNVKNDLSSKIKTANDKYLKTQSEIFQAHLELLQDITLFDKTVEYMQDGYSAPWSWQQAINDNIQIIKSANNKYLNERVADFLDIKDSVLRYLLHLTDPNEFLVTDKEVILIADDLVPSDVAKLGVNIKGVVLVGGSATSHVSLILRNMGVPALVAVDLGITKLANDSLLVLNCIKGVLIGNVAEDELKHIVDEKNQLERIKQDNIANCKLDAITKDGNLILVKANVSNAKEALSAFELGGDGIGLLRSEFLFFNSRSEPNVDQQSNLYQDVLNSMSGNAITIRTFDIGGDKPLPFIEIDDEENPILGVRGIRNYMSTANNKEVFLRHIRAILSVNPLNLCKIMIPMVSDVDEFLNIKNLILEQAQELKCDLNKVHIGIMVEVPSAAILLDLFAPHIDFCSIGTNDLAQYTLAMDRGNSLLTKRLSNLHPSLLRMLKIAVDYSKNFNLPIAVCGAMASELLAVPLLLGLGIVELSVSMRSIPDVKALVRKLDTDLCTKVVNEALSLKNASAVENLVLKNFEING